MDKTITVSKERLEELLNLEKKTKKFICTKCKCLGLKRHALEYPRTVMSIYVSQIVVCYRCEGFFCCNCAHNFTDGSFKNLLFCSDCAKIYDCHLQQ